MSLEIWFWLLWVAYSAAVVLLMFSPRTKNPAAQPVMASDDGVEVVLTPRA